MRTQTDPQLGATADVWKSPFGMMSGMTVLTSQMYLGSFLRDTLEEAKNALDNFDDSKFEDTDALHREITDTYGVELLEVLHDQISRIATRPQKVSVRDRAGRLAPSQELIATYRVPYSGERDLWSMQPRGELLTGERDPLSAFTIGDSEHLVLTLRVTGMEARDVENARKQNLGWLDTKVAWANDQINEFNSQLRSSLNEAIARRVHLIEQGRALDDASDIPLYKAPLEEQVPVPLKRRRVRPAPSSHATTNDPVMADDIYNDVVQTIEQMTAAMERTPATAAKLHEEEVRNLILFVLNANYRGAVAGEVFNGEGKTDILLRWDDVNAFIGECKFWKGSAAFREAIDQLHRYVTWRDTKAALIVFIRGGKPTEIMDKAKSELRGHPTFVKELPTVNGQHDTRAQFVLASTSDSDKQISVALIGVIIPSGDAV